VLVTAEATNSAADVSRRASSALENGLDLLQKRVDLVASASADTVKLSKRILFGAIGGLVIGLGLLGGVTYLIINQGSQIDDMLVQVTGRIEKMNSALDTFETLKVSIDELAATQAAFTDQQALLGEAVAKAETSANSLRQQVPEAAAKTLSVETDKMAAQVKDLSGDLRKQAKQIASMGSKLESFKTRIDEVQALNAGVQALITLEKQNYRALLERKMALEQKTGVVAPADPNLVYYSIRNSK
jgi:cell division septum initiation protein DivIVA